MSEYARFVCKVPKDRLQVQRHGVVDFCRNPRAMQVVPNCVPLLGSNDKLVVHVIRPWRYYRQPDQVSQFGLGKQASIATRISPAGPGPLVEVAQLDAQDSSLQSIQAAIQAQDFIVVLRSATWLP